MPNYLYCFRYLQRNEGDLSLSYVQSGNAWRMGICIDFTSCITDGICVLSDWQELVGVVVNTYQAAELSKFLDITVKD